MRTGSLLPRLLLVAVLTGVIAFLALRTSPYLQYIPWMPRSLGIWADHNGILRNVAAFFFFALVVLLLLGHSWTRVVALCVFAAAVEFGQRWVPGRVFDWWDIVASIAGILAAWPLAWLVRRKPAPR
jgi:hypothetical protein